MSHSQRPAQSSRLSSKQFFILQTDPNTVNRDFSPTPRNHIRDPDSLIPTAEH